MVAGDGRSLREGLGRTLKEGCWERLQKIEALHAGTKIDGSAANLGVPKLGASFAWTRDRVEDLDAELAAACDESEEDTGCGADDE